MSLFTAAAMAALIPLISAQTFSACNPMFNTSCPPNPAIAENFECDFKTGESALNGWKITAGSLKYAADGAEFTIDKRGDAPTIQTNGYMLFGRAEVKTKAASGQGVISSIVLQSEALDEVDWEFIGGVNTEVQSNYFGKGNTTTYDRMLRHPVETPQQIAHTYIVDWTAERINFYIDDATTPVRTLNYADANDGKNYPQTPMNLRIGIWAGGDPDNSPGTIEWAGGETDYTKTPYTQLLEYVKVTNYSPGKEYKWNDQSGSYQSIEVVAGEPETGSPADPVESPSGAEEVVAPTGTAAPSAGAPDSPGGLGGGNGGNTATGVAPIPTSAAPDSPTPSSAGGEFYDNASSHSTSCSTTVTVTVTEGEELPTPEPTMILPTEGTDVPVPSSIIIDTSVPSIVTTVSSLIPSIPIATTTQNPNATPPPFTGAAAAPTALGGMLVAGVAAAIFM